MSGDELNVEHEKLRLEAMRWCETAVDEEQGVKVYHPVYKAVTENRDPGPQYSSCGDLAHWLLFRMGVRSTWVNRKEHKGWRSGLNVSLLAYTCPVARAPKKGELLSRGDIMIVWNSPQGFDAHVNVVDNFDGQFVWSWDYGQAALNPATWNKEMVEGCRRRNPLKDLSTGWQVGTRKLQKVIPLIDLLDDCRSRNLLVEPDDQDAWLAKLGG